MAGGCTRSGVNTASHTSSFDSVMGGDLADCILLRLCPAALARLSCACRLTYGRCGHDSLWFNHFRRQLYLGRVGGGSHGTSVHSRASHRRGEHEFCEENEFEDYLERMVAVARASWGRTASGFVCRCGAVVSGRRSASSARRLRDVFGWRMAQRQKVLKAWGQVSLFLTSGAPLGQGLTDLEMWRLERFPVFQCRFKARVFTLSARGWREVAALV